MDPWTWVKLKLAKVTEALWQVLPDLAWANRSEDTHKPNKDRGGGNQLITILKALNTLSVLSSIREEEQEEPGGCASRTNPSSCDGDSRDIQDREDRQHNLMRIIWFLIATSSIDNDRAVVFDICERASASEANAKEAIEAISREFKYGVVSQQLSAARLWEVMLRNSSELFVCQCAKREFIDTLEDVLTSLRTSPVVRKRLLEVLAVAADVADVSPYGSSFRVLWRKVKFGRMLDEGVPPDPDNAMTNNPSSSRRSTAITLTPDRLPVHPQSSQAGASTDTDSILYAMQLQREFDEEDRALSLRHAELVETARGWFECGVCMDEMPLDSIAQIDSCDHTFCRDCLRGHVTARLDEHRFPILCPTCTASKGKGEVGEVSQSLALNLGLTDEQFGIWTEMEMAAFSVLLHCRGCQRSMFVARDEHEVVNLITCPLPDCNHAWCKQCQQSIDLHGPKHSCDGTSELDHLMKEQGWKYCPTCKTPVQKESGCNHMTCVTPACNTHFCYLCGDLIVKSAVAQEIVEAKSSHFRQNCALFAVPE